MDFSPLSYTVITSAGGGSYDFQAITIPTVYSPITNPLSDETISHLISISIDGSVFAFDAETTELDEVDVGEIIIGGISTVAPEGFLRKVVSIQSDGDNLIYITEGATIEEAFESLSVNVIQPLTPADVQNILKKHCNWPLNFAKYWPKNYFTDSSFDLISDQSSQNQNFPTPWFCFRQKPLNFFDQKKQVEQSFNGLFSFIVFLLCIVYMNLKLF